MNPSEEKEEEKPKLTVPRRSSLKFRQPTKLDPDAIMKAKPAGKFKRNSVSWGKSNTFEFKAMKAMFTESEDINKKETEEDKEKHKKFLESRKASIKNEFSLLKEMMKKSAQDIIEEENDEETKENMRKNLQMGKEALKEVSESSESSHSRSKSGSRSNSKSGSRSNSKSGSRSRSKSSSKSGSRSGSKSKSKNSSKRSSVDKKESGEENKEEKNKKKRKVKVTEKDKEESDKQSEKSERESDKENKKEKLKKMRKVKLENKPKKKEEKNESDHESEKDKDSEEVKPKRKRRIQIEEEPKEEQKEEKLKLKENEPKINEKVRLISIEEANNLDLDKIAYITLTDGTVAVLKKEGQIIIQDLNQPKENNIEEQNIIKNNKQNFRQHNPINNEIQQNIIYPNNQINQLPNNQQIIYQQKLHIRQNQNNINPQEELYYQDNIYENPNNLPMNQNYIRNIPRNNNNQFNQQIPSYYENNENQYYDNFNTIQNIQSSPVYPNNVQPHKLKHINSMRMISPQYINRIQGQNQQFSQYSYQNQYQRIPKPQYFIQKQNNINNRDNYMRFGNSINVNNINSPKLPRTFKYKLIEAIPVKFFENFKLNRNKPQINCQFVEPYFNQPVFLSAPVSPKSFQYQRQPINSSESSTINNYNNDNKYNSYEQEVKIFNKQIIDPFKDFDRLEKEPYNYQNVELYRNCNCALKYSKLSPEQEGRKLKSSNISKKYMQSFGRQGVTNTNNNFKSGGFRHVRNQTQNYDNQNYKESKGFI